MPRVRLNATSSSWMTLDTKVVRVGSSGKPSFIRSITTGTRRWKKPGCPPSTCERGQVSHAPTKETGTVHCKRVEEFEVRILSAWHLLAVADGAAQHTAQDVAEARPQHGHGVARRHCQASFVVRFHDVCHVWSQPEVGHPVSSHY